MEDASEARCVDAVLLRAGEQLGDITPEVARLFHERMPDAMALFRHHEPHDPARLEGEMVAQALHCLTYWHESPGEIEIILTSTLPHHIETLDVSHEVFAQYLNAVCDVIADTIPEAAEDERQAWVRLQEELLAVIALGASYARPDLVRRGN